MPSDNEKHGISHYFLLSNYEWFVISLILFFVQDSKFLRFRILCFWITPSTFIGSFALCHDLYDVPLLTHISDYLYDDPTQIQASKDIWDEAME
jgi:hypothetical protein